jgi:hypothetical protein
MGSAIMAVRRTAQAAFVCLLILPGYAAAQATTAEQAQSVNVFLDCQAPGCDSEHFRTEIEFVNWVRDRTDADVHLLITAQGSAAGGTAYQLNYIGQRGFAGDSLTLPLAAEQNLTDPEQRELLTQRIAQGLLHYATRTAIANRLRIELAPVRERDTASTRSRDPWNLWVFSVGLDLATDGESRELSRELELSLTARRISEDWKLRFNVEGNYEENRFELTNRTATNVTRDYSGSALIARSLASLWSAGLSVEVGSSTFRNQDLYARAATVLEYSFFPYDQFSRRQLALQYSVGARHFRYHELTIYDRLEEQRLDHRLMLSLEFQQPWGQAGASVSGSHYLHNVHRANLSIDGEVEVRLFRGLSLEVSAGYSRVHDQLYIPKGDATDEEVLLRRRALATNYRYGTSVGLSYTFGSIYNNIVNPRLVDR